MNNYSPWNGNLPPASSVPFTCVQLNNSRYRPAASAGGFEHVSTVTVVYYHFPVDKNVFRAFALYICPFFITMCFYLSSYNDNIHTSLVACSCFRLALFICQEWIKSGFGKKKKNNQNMFQDSWQPSEWWHSIQYIHSQVCINIWLWLFDRNLSVVPHASPSTWMAFSNFLLSSHWSCSHFNERVFCFAPQPGFDPSVEAACGPCPVFVHTSKHQKTLKGGGGLSSLISWTEACLSPG